MVAIVAWGDENLKCGVCVFKGENECENFLKSRHRRGGATKNREGEEKAFDLLKALFGTFSLQEEEKWGLSEVRLRVGFWWLDGGRRR